MLSVVGMSTIDHVFYLDSFPEVDTEVRATEALDVVGGLGGRGALAALCYSDSPVYLRTIIGAGSGLFSRLNSVPGLVVSVCPSDLPAQQSAVLVSGIHRTVCYKSTPIGDIPAYVLESFGQEIPSETTTLLLDASIPVVTETMINFAKREGIKTVIDTGASHNYVTSLLPLVDHVIMPERFFSNNFKNMTLSEVAEVLPCDAIAVTKGIDGGQYVTDGEVWNWEAAKVDTVDSCGAGDVFHGFYAAAIDKGESVAMAIEGANTFTGRFVAKRGNELLDEILEVEPMYNL